MDAVTAVKLIMIAFELIVSVIMTSLICRALGKSPIRAAIAGLEVLAFMIVATLPKPRPRPRRIQGPQHRLA